MAYQEVKEMVREWIVNNKRPMTVDDALSLYKLTGEHCAFLFDLYKAARTFALVPSEKQFKERNNFDVKFVVCWRDLRHGPQPCIYGIN